MQNKQQKRIIMHVDMDAFFAAIEERDNPTLKGLPIVVGTSTTLSTSTDPKNGFGRGVVSTANYKARAYGIHSAMPISWAWRLSEETFKKGLCPRAVFLPVNMKKYQEASKRISVLLHSYTRLIEQASIDEAYLQFNVKSQRSNVKCYKETEEIARNIKREIRKEEKLSCSIGIGPNKLIAKIASGFRKPNGLTLVPPEEAENFLAPLPIRAIPGIGPKTEAFLNKKDIYLVADIKKFWKSDFQNWLGKGGAEIYEKAWGIDNRPLSTSWRRKSLGHQETLPFDTLKTSLLIKTLRELTKETVSQLQKEHLYCRTVEVRVRFADFETKTRCKTLLNPTGGYEKIWENVLALFLPFLDARENPFKKPIRLLGVAVSNF